MTDFIKFSDNTVSHATGHVWCHANHVRISHDGATYRFVLQHVEAREGNSRPSVIIYADSGRTTLGSKLQPALAQYLAKIVSDIYRLDSYDVILNKDEVNLGVLETSESLEPAV
jgi:hypothetical protein